MPQAGGASIETPAREAQDAAGRYRLRREGYLAFYRSRPSKDCANPCEQLAGTEWLRQIIVGPHLEPDDPIRLAVDRGQEDDRRSAGGTYLPA